MEIYNYYGKSKSTYLPIKFHKIGLILDCTRKQWMVYIDFYHWMNSFRFKTKVLVLRQKLLKKFQQKLRRFTEWIGGIKYISMIYTSLRANFQVWFLGRLQMSRCYNNMEPFWDLESFWCQTKLRKHQIFTALITRPIIHIDGITTETEFPLWNETLLFSC